MSGLTDAWMRGLTDAWMSELTDLWMNGWMGGYSASFGGSLTEVQPIYL